MDALDLELGNSSPIQLNLTSCLYKLNLYNMPSVYQPFWKRYSLCPPNPLSFNLKNISPPLAISCTIIPYIIFYNTNINTHSTSSLDSNLSTNSLVFGLKFFFFIKFYMIGKILFVLIDSEIIVVRVATIYTIEPPCVMVTIQVSCTLRYHLNFFFPVKYLSETISHIDITRFRIIYIPIAYTIHVIAHNSHDATVSSPAMRIIVIIIPSRYTDESMLKLYNIRTIGLWVFCFIQFFSNQKLFP